MSSKKHLLGNLATATSEEIIPSSRQIYFSVILEGQPLEEYVLFILFNRQIVLDNKWEDKILLKSSALPVNLDEPSHQQLISDHPLMFLLRAPGGKPSKEVDPLCNENNRAGANIDLFPFVLGAESINVTVPLLSLTTGKSIGCVVEINVIIDECISEQTKIPLLMTLLSAHCLPSVKEGTAYLAAVGLDEVFESTSIDFGLSLNPVLSTTNKVFSAKVSTGGYAAITAFNVPQDDVFIPSDLVLHNTPECNSVYWKAMRRVLVDPSSLRCRLSSPIFIDIAGVQMVGKPELRCRYMGFIDGKVLLEPGQYGVTISTNLFIYNENELPTCGPLLNVPPSSARTPNTVRNTEIVKDEYDHSTYIVLRLDLAEPLVPKTKTAQLFKNLSGEGTSVPVNNTFPSEPCPENTLIDARKLRKEGGALAIHRELSILTMTTQGVVPMGQSIKRTAASRLMMRVRTMLKECPPCCCSEIEWQDTVTGQHAATRRAVTASFAPQLPPPRLPAPLAASRCRMAGDTRLANRNVADLITATAAHPKSLLSKALSYIEEGKEEQARCCYLQALTIQPKNKYLLWLFAGQELSKTPAVSEAAIALNIAVKGDSSDGISKTIAWAAVHTLHHYMGHQYSAFVAAKNMRKAYALHQDWKKFYDRWVQNSGEEEVLWIPTAIDASDPFSIAAAFFLCLKCYFFTERLLQCLEKKCSNRGAQQKFNQEITPDIYYLRAASLLLRRDYKDALQVTEKGIGRFGPCAILLQMQTSCLTCIRGWDTDCEASFLKTDRAGAQKCPVLLLRAAWGSFHTDLGIALQRAARCHKIAPGGHSALLIGRIYAKIGDYFLSERWAATAVKIEPLLADGWAFLAILAMEEGEIEKARGLIRTAKQTGPISEDLMKEMDNLMQKLRMQTLPDVLMKDVCYCDYYS